MSDFFDIDSYLNRIGLPAPTDEQRYQDGLILLRDIMAAHSRTIPFENLDIVLKRNLPVSLESMELEAKMVSQSRGTVKLRVFLNGGARLYAIYTCT